MEDVLSYDIRPTLTHEVTYGHFRIAVGVLVDTMPFSSASSRWGCDHYPTIRIALIQPRRRLSKVIQVERGLDEVISSWTVFTT